MKNFHFSAGRELTFVVCFIATVSCGIEQSSPENEQAICNKYNNPVTEWTCKRVENCQWAKNSLETRSEYPCNGNGSTKKICCPNNRISSLPSHGTTRKPPLSARRRKDYAQIIRKKCDEYAQARYVVKCYGGDLIGEEPVCGQEMDCVDKTIPLITAREDATPKEFPHMALVGTGDDVTNIVWRCGGSLISDRFILSAAHCTGEGYTTQIRWATLGIVDRREATADKLNKNIFKIVETYNHPAYRMGRVNYDIALYKLENAVKFNPHIRPICLPTESGLPQKNHIQGIITGWGINETGFDVINTLQKAYIGFLSNESCVHGYRNDKRLAKGFEVESMVCTGDLQSKKHTCQGDSGGPLQIKHRAECMYMQVGVTSLFSSSCGSPTPAIYTRVFAYLEWIVEKVWPEDI